MKRGHRFPSTAGFSGSAGMKYIGPYMRRPGSGAASDMDARLAEEAQAVQAVRRRGLTLSDDEVKQMRETIDKGRGERRLTLKKGGRVKSRCKY